MKRKVKPTDSIPEETSSFQGKLVSDKVIPSKESGGEKKPFDKKLWRTQKYSKKYKLQQWEEKRKKVVMKEYYRQIKDDAPKFDVQKIYDQDEAENDNENNLNADIKAGQNERRGRNRKEGSFKRKNEEEVFQARSSYKEKQEERNKAKNEAQERRKQLMKKINKRTKKGQLCLNDRIELLYSEIKGKMEEEKDGNKK